MTLPEPLQGMADRAPLMLVFLRHFGCTFCRETLADIARQKDAIAATGAQVAFVHMSEPGDADRWFEHYDVADMTRISDPQKHLYRLFALEEGSLNQLAHPRVWWPWFRTAVMVAMARARPDRIGGSSPASSSFTKAGFSTVFVIGTRPDDQTT